MNKDEFMAVWPEIQQSVADVYEELQVTDKLLADCRQLLDAIPQCPVHGPCIPYALEWIEKQKHGRSN